MKKILILGLAIVMCICSLVIPASAADGTTPPGYGVATFQPRPGSGTSDSETGSKKPSNSGSNGFFGDIQSPDEVLGMDSSNVVTTDDVNNWIEAKGNDLISIMTKGVQVVAVIGFIAALLLIIIGALGDKRTMTAGFIALVISCVVFAVSTCAPQIMATVSSWLQS